MNAIIRVYIYLVDYIFSKTTITILFTIITIINKKKSSLAAQRALFGIYAPYTVIHLIGAVLTKNTLCGFSDHHATTIVTMLQ